MSQTKARASAGRGTLQRQPSLQYLTRSLACPSRPAPRRWSDTSGDFESAVRLESRNAMGADKASLLAADLTIPQAWGLAVQGHPAGFEAIKYPSRFLDQSCLALFERGGLESRLRVSVLGVLTHLDAAVDWLDERKAALV